MGVVDTLILSEGLRKYRVKLKCTSCDYAEELTLGEDALNDFNPPNCSKCKTSTPMEIDEKIDLIDELSTLST
jgi:peptide chain release factor subunit 1